MKAFEDYNCIEFSGLTLNPTFSIYLFEIIKDDTEWFYYLGMTGDNFYPSARSILHRLAGHISLINKSTQNQFINGLSKNIFKKNENIELTIEELNQLKIKLHHWPIEGFFKWNGSLKGFNVENLSESERVLYKEFKDKQSEILKLEKYLIQYLHSQKHLNCFNAAENGNLELNDLYNYIFEHVKTITQNQNKKNG